MIRRISLERVSRHRCRDFKLIMKVQESSKRMIYLVGRQVGFKTIGSDLHDLGKHRMIDRDSVPLTLLKGAVEDQVSHDRLAKDMA
jgi:hypothetical protein